LTVVSPILGFLQLDDTCVGVYNGHTYISSTVFIDTLYGAITGCDSMILQVTINIVPPNLKPNLQNISICPGDSFFAAGQYRYTPGSYGDTIRTTLGGCDSLINLVNLSYITPAHSSQSFDTCNAVTINGVAYSTDTTLADTLRTAQGCDSLIQNYSLHIKASSITIVSSALLPITEGDSTQLSISPAGNYQNIVWSPNQWITNRFLAAPVVLPNVSTAYMVTAEDSNHCNISAELIVTVLPAGSSGYVMPTAFSPNGDGKNELIGPILDTLVQLVTYHVYNRWGELVFDNANGSGKWDGSYKNSQQPTGVYLYFITVLATSGKEISAEGSITLLR
jgi:gliding motility-associated-like protein